MTSVLQHSNLAIKAVDSFMSLSDQKITEIKTRLTETNPEVMSDEETLVFQFMQLRKKADDLLKWMMDRVQPQKYFNHALELTLEIAK